MTVGAHLPFQTITIGTVFSGGTLLALIALLIRQIGPWRKQATEASDGLIKQLQEDGRSQREDVEKLKSAVEALTARCQASDLRVGQLEFALQVATNEIERAAPDSNVPSQIRRLLATVLPKEVPSGITQEQMDILRQVR